MYLRRLLVLSGMWALGGCLYHARDRADEALQALAERPYDLLPSDSSAGAIENTAASMQGKPQPANTPSRPLDVQTAAFMQPTEKPKIEPKIPPQIPGSEAKPIELPRDPAAKQRAIEQLYPALTPLPAQPVPVPGPNGRPYTLSDLQQIAATNRPELPQHPSNVQVP